MLKFSVLLCVSFGHLMTEAVPQYGPPSIASQPQAQPAQSPYAGAGQSQPLQSSNSESGQFRQVQASYIGVVHTQQAPSSYGAAGQPRQAQSSYGAAGQPQQAEPSYGSSARNDLTVQCKATPTSNGNIKYDCSGVNKDAITLKTEHILWLETETPKPQNLDIQIPNYYIDEFIKAAIKAAAPREADKVNILLKKPYVSYNAQKGDAPKPQVPQPDVKVNYQPVDKISVHYPTQKGYQSSASSSTAAASAPASYSSSPYSR